MTKPTMLAIARKVYGDKVADYCRLNMSDVSETTEICFQRTTAFLSHAAAVTQDTRPSFAMTRLTSVNGDDVLENF